MKRVEQRKLRIEFDLMTACKKVVVFWCTGCCSSCYELKTRKKEEVKEQEVKEEEEEERRERSERNINRATVFSPSRGGIYKPGWSLGVSLALTIVPIVLAIGHCL